MYPVLLLAALAILAGVVVVAMGRGGELMLFRSDVPEFRFRIRTPADVATLRLPIGLLGYREPATGDALRAIASLLAERDAEIAWLRDRLERQGAVSESAPAQSPGVDDRLARLGGVSEGEAAEKLAVDDRLTTLDAATDGAGDEEPGITAQPAVPT